MPTDNRPTLAIDTSTSFCPSHWNIKAKSACFMKTSAPSNPNKSCRKIECLFKEAGITAADLGCIVYAQGPGAFTGLRIGAAVALVWPRRLSTPMIGIPCPRCRRSLLPPSSCVLAATDARMGEVFYAWFDTKTTSA